jgi:hypothetical protein
MTGSIFPDLASVATGNDSPLASLGRNLGGTGNGKLLERNIGCHTGHSHTNKTHTDVGQRFQNLQEPGLFELRDAISRGVTKDVFL